MKFSESGKTNRKPAVAGQFYPATSDKLQKELNKLFEKAEKKQASEEILQAIISPHAGYIFSGQVAASAFNQIQDKALYEHVIVLASSHQFHFSGAAVYTGGNYETPLGEIETDIQEAKKIIDSSPVFHDNPEAHLYEHSLEVQLPFLQHKLGHNFKLIPIILGTNSALDCKKIATALSPYFTPENLFVISTDFSHYPNYNDAGKIDTTTANAICKNKAEALLTTLEGNASQRIKGLATSLCGWTSVLTLLYLTEKKKVKFSQIDYKNSGDTALYGDKKRVVGYWAIAVYAKTAPFSISEDDKHEILDHARKAIDYYLKIGEKSQYKKAGPGSILNKKIGAFVSVYVDSELRGCIGGFARNKSLNKIISEMSVSAICDRRFKTVNLSELDQLTLEISLLSPLKKIHSPKEIELGRHGIYIRKGLNSGTFLPQVVKKTNWNVSEYLGHCAREKAGLGWEGWKTAELFTYEVVIIKD